MASLFKKIIYDMLSRFSTSLKTKEHTAYRIYIFFLKKCTDQKIDLSVPPQIYVENIVSIHYFRHF